jgi:hypothetical protein
VRVQLAHARLVDPFHEHEVVDARNRELDDPDPEGEFGQVVLTRPLRLERLSSGRGLSVPARCALRRDLRRGHHDDGPVSVLKHRVGDAAEP